MKKIITLLSIVSILFVAGFLFFKGIDPQPKVSSIDNTVNDKKVSKASPLIAENVRSEKTVSQGAKLIASNLQSEKANESVAAPPRPRKSLLSERKRMKKSGSKFDQPDMFDKIQKMIRTREGQSEPTYQPNYKFIEFNKLKNNSKFSKTVANLNWVERGPANVGGRTRGIVVDPDDASKNTWYVGSVGGGVWKTTDAGTSWRNLTDEIPNLATTAIALCRNR